MTQEKTNDQILGIARDLLATGGIGAVSFDSIARRLGRSKQAVLYWYPNKQELLAAMFLPWLEAEAEVASNAVARASGRAEAISAFVKAVAAFHLDNLDRFRMMYLLPQTIKTGSVEVRDSALLGKVHPVTDRVYGALAAFLDRDPVDARREAVAIHASVLGLLLMFGLADSLGDPLKHATQDMIDALIASLKSK